MAARKLKLQFPAGGLDERLGFQDQKPFTTPFCLNVRPTDPLDQRRRGGSRPDLLKAYSQHLGKISGTDNGTSSGNTFVATAAVFLEHPTAVGKWIIMDTSGRRYSISSFVSTSSVGITQTWNAADDDDTFTVWPYSPISLLATMRTVNLTGERQFEDWFGGIQDEALSTYDSANWDSAATFTGFPYVSKVTRASGTSFDRESASDANQEITFSGSGNVYDIVHVIDANNMLVRAIDSLGNLATNEALGDGYTFTVGSVSRSGVMSGQPSLGSDATEMTVDISSSGEATYAKTDGASGISGGNLGVGVIKSGVTALIDQTQPYTISIVPTVFGEGKRIYIWLGMDNTTPAESSSLAVDVWRVTDTVTWVFIYKDGITVASGQFEYEIDKTLELTYDPVSKNLTALWGKAALVSYDTGSYVLAGHRVAIGASTADEGANTDLWIDYVSIRYNVSSVSPKELIVAAAGGNLYKEAPSGTMSAIGTPNGITLETRPAETADRLGKLYIAEWYKAPREERLLSSGAVTLDFASGTLTDATITNPSTFTTVGETYVHAKGDVCEITAVTGGDLAKGWYEVTSVTNATSVVIKKFDGTAAATGDATALAYRIVPGIKVYDADADTLQILTAVGNLVDPPTTVADVPHGCIHVAVHNDRLVLSGDPQNESTIYMSTQADPLDWNEDADEETSAVFTGSGFKGTIGAAVTGLVPLPRGEFLMCTNQDIWLLRGDFRQGASFDQISNSVGMVSGRAWALDAENNLYWMSHNGIHTLEYKREGSDDLTPVKYSKERAPKRLVNISPILNSITMELNPAEGGMYIWSTTVDTLFGQNTANFYIEPATGAFIPDQIQGNGQITTSAYLGRNNRMIVGCADGFLRRYDFDAGGDDDGTARTASVDYGPIPLNRGRGAMAESLQITLDKGSSSVPWTFRTGRTAEEAFSAAFRASGTALAGDNYLQPVRMFGQYGFLRLSTSVAASWAVEEITLRVLPAAADQRKI